MRERDVLDYLRNNPKFFRRHQSELSRLLRLAERDVVDLTGRQLVALRDENTLMRNQLRDWYNNAADNEGIIDFLHKLAIGLVRNNGKTGNAEKVLKREVKTAFELDLCKLVDLTSAKAPKLTDNELSRIYSCNDVLRTTVPLTSLRHLVPKNYEWKAFLFIPVWMKDKLQAIIVCASHRSREFPHDASADYAIRMAELVGMALSNEPKEKKVVKVAKVAKATKTARSTSKVKNKGKGKAKK